VCNHCQAYKGQRYLQQEKERYKQKFEQLLTDIRNQHEYDCLMAYSGGKDSTYTLSILKNAYGLNILAVTFDNGFISPFATENIRKVTDRLGIDHYFIKPSASLLKKIFIESSKNELYPAKALERASTICTSCMGLVKFISLRLALEKKIPLLAYGWSPGQAPLTASIFKNNPAMLFKMQQAIQEPLAKIVGAEINRFFLTEEMKDSKLFPYSVSPLAFLDYNEEDIYIANRQLGWEKPLDTDANSSNCLLNSYANIVHKNKFHFHTYAFEMAKLVREGYLERAEAISRLESEEDVRTVHYVQQKLFE